jgi:hypothetical protein
MAAVDTLPVGFTSVVGSLVVGSLVADTSRLDTWWLGMDLAHAS